MSDKKQISKNELFRHRIPPQEAAGALENIVDALTRGLNIRLWRSWETSGHSEEDALKQKIADLETQRAEARALLAQTCENPNHGDGEFYLEVRLVKKTELPSAGQEHFPVEIMSKN